MSWFAKKEFDGGGKSLSDLRGRAAHGVDFLGFFRKIICFFKKKSLGTAILETALTLPVVLYIIFFSIELIRMELAQTAVDSITKELTFYLMAKGKIVQSEVDAIFEKYRPWGIPIGHFRYIISMYSDFHTDDKQGVMDVSPYGGSSIEWLGEDYANPNPNRSPTQRASWAVYGRGNEGNQAKLLKYHGGYGPKVSSIKELLEGDLPSSGYIFVLTVTLNFPFSSPFVKKLFGGGTNTNRDGVYILWARGSGMIN